MGARIEGWHVGHRIVSFAREESCACELGEEGLEFIRIVDGELELHPSGMRFALSSAACDELAGYQDFDVVEILDSGRLVRCYSDAADDNAIVVTGRCNSSCIMCPDSDRTRARAETRSLDTLIDLVRHIPSDARHLTITGGEPFLMGPDLFTVFEAMTARFTRTDFLLLTNGRIFSVDSYCNRLARTLPRRTTLGIPLHGSTSRLHDRITQAPGSFDQTLAGIRNVIALGFPVELRVVVSKATAPDMDGIADLIIRELAGVSCVKVMGLEMLGSAARNRDDIWLPYPHAFAASRNAITSLIAHGIDVGIYNFPLCSVDRAFWPICEKSISGYKVRYAAACESCAIGDACGGLFASSLRLAEPALSPFGKVV